MACRQQRVPPEQGACRPTLCRSPPSIPSSHWLLPQAPAVAGSSSARRHNVARCAGRNKALTELYNSHGSVTPRVLGPCEQRPQFLPADRASPQQEVGRSYRAGGRGPQQQRGQPPDEQAAKRPRDDDLKDAGRQRVLAPAHILRPVGVSHWIRLFHCVQWKLAQRRLHCRLFSGSAQQGLFSLQCKQQDHCLLDCFVFSQSHVWLWVVKSILFSLCPPQSCAVDTGCLIYVANQPGTDPEWGLPHLWRPGDRKPEALHNAEAACQHRHECDQHPHTQPCGTALQRWLGWCWTALLTSIAAPD